MKKLSVAVSVLAMIGIWMPGALAAPLTVSQCIAQALRYSPELAAVQHDIAAAGYEITKQRGTTLPYLSSQLTAYEINGAPVTPFSILNLSTPENPISRRANAHWDPVGMQVVNATYPLYLYGSIMGLNHPPVVAVAEAELNEQELTIILAQQKVILDVFTAYSQAIWYRDLERLSQEIIKFSQQEIDIVTDQVGLGLKIPQAIDLAKAQLAAGVEAEASARHNDANATSELATFMGRGSDTVLDLDDTKPRLPPLQPLKEFLARTLPTHPALKIQQNKVEIARQQYRVDRASLLPTVSLNTTFAGGEDLEYINGNHNHRNPTAFLAYLEVDAPLFDFGQRRAAMHESSEKISSATERTRQLELDLRKAITQNYEQIRDLDSQLALLQRDLVNATNDVHLARAQRAEGMIDALTLVESELALLYIRSNLEYDQFEERLLYAELQNLSAGAWRWIQ